MLKPAAHFREAGTGTGVVCLHSSASSSGQWRGLMDRLSDRFHIIAADLHGCGESPAWDEDRGMHLDDEVSLLEPVFRSAGDRCHLVGHSYGAAVALRAALNESRIESLVLYEPVLFSVLVADDPDGAAAREISSVRDDTSQSITGGDLDAAAQRFIDYWLGPGSWSGVPAERRPAMAERMCSVVPQWHAAFGEPTLLSEFAGVEVPTLLLTGSRSPAPTRRISALLRGVLPQARSVELEGLGHMGPVTHPERVNGAIEDFLREELDSPIHTETGEICL